MHTKTKPPQLTSDAAWELAIEYFRDWDTQDLREIPEQALVDDYLADEDVFEEDWAMVFGEGRRGFARRVDAFGRQCGLGALPGDRYVQIVDFQLSLSSCAGQRAVRQLLEEVVADRGHAPSLVVIDTLAAHWAESEDSAEFAGPAMRALAEVADSLGCTVLVLHHVTESAGRSGMPSLGDPRGSGAYGATADFVLGMCAKPGGALLGALKLKDDERPREMRLRLQSVDCGCDTGGEPVSAGVFQNRAEPHRGESDGKHDDVDEDVRRIVQELAGLESCSSKDGICRAAGIGFPTGRAAVDSALTGGLVRKRKRDGAYVVTAAGRPRFFVIGRPMKSERRVMRRERGPRDDTGAGERRLSRGRRASAPRQCGVRASVDGRRRQTSELRLCGISVCGVPTLEGTPRRVLVSHARGLAACFSLTTRAHARAMRVLGVGRLSRHGGCSGQLARATAFGA